MEKARHLICLGIEIHLNPHPLIGIISYMMSYIIINPPKPN